MFTRQAFLFFQILDLNFMLVVFVAKPVYILEITNSGIRKTNTTRVHPVCAGAVVLHAVTSDPH